jgi:hypothetical protein
MLTGASYTAVDLSLLSTGDNVTLTVPAGLKYDIGTYIKACVTGTSYEYFQGTINYYDNTTLTLKAEYFYGSISGDQWKLGIAGKTGPVGPEGAPGAQGGVGQVPDGYFVMANEGYADSGALYQLGSSVGINNNAPAAGIDVSGNIRASEFLTGEPVGGDSNQPTLTSGIVVINPATGVEGYQTGVLHYMIPKIEYQIFAGDGLTDTFTLESPCRGAEWLLMWNANATSHPNPNQYSVNGKTVIFDSQSVPIGDIEVRHIIL